MRKMNYADHIFIDATIITMDAHATRATAIAFKDGRILAVGTPDEVLHLRNHTTVVEKLEGATVLPGFIDAHSHFSVVAATLATIPLDTVKSFEQLQSTLSAYKHHHDQWLIGMNYDASITDTHYLTCNDLDKISKDQPILILYKSLHRAVVNSKALSLMHNHSGSIRDQNSLAKKSHGVLEEHALEAFLSVLPSPPLDLIQNMITKAFTLYTAQGITTAQEGAASSKLLQTLSNISHEKPFPIDLVAYHLYETSQQEIFTCTTQAHSNYHNGFRRGGIKLILDGSIQGYTAYLRDPYFTIPLSLQHNLRTCTTQACSNYRGYPAFPNLSNLTKTVAYLLQSGYHLLIHVNGDAAIDQFIACMQNLMHMRVTSQHITLIHAQTIREDQLDMIQKLGVALSFFPGHIYYWGDLHRTVFLGPLRAQRLNPARSALARNISVTLHHDAPVTPIQMFDVIASAVNRTTSSGFILGANESISVYEALRAITREAAAQYGEENDKGSLEVGKYADMVIVSDDPLQINTHHLKSIKILRTIKAGVTVYKA
jgi:predicted amidohydrolase YtcJ